MKWKLNLIGSPNAMYYLMKFTGLAPFVMKNNRFYPPTFIDKIYTLFVAASYFIFVTITYTPILEGSYGKGFSLFISNWSMIIHVSSMPTIIATLITFLLMNQKVVYLMNEMCIVSNELKNLGFEKENENCLTKLWKTTVIANVALAVTCLIIISLETNWHVFLSIKFCIDSWFSLNTALIFAQTLSCIRRYFTLVNKKLYDLSLPNPQFCMLPNHSRNYVARVNVGDENQSGSKCASNLERLQKIEDLHLELCNLVDRTARLFATPILLNTFRLSTSFMLFLYYFYSVLQQSSFFEPGAVLCTLLRMAIAIFVLFVTAHASAMTCKEGNATKAVLFKVWIALRPVELTNEFLMFSVQLLHTPVIVSAFGFMDLNYSFVFKIFSTIVTYLIVMIQLGK